MSSSSSSSRQRTISKEESLRSKKSSDKRYESKTTERRREEERSRNGKHSSVKQEATPKPSSPKPSHPPNPLASRSYQSSKHSPSKSSPKPSHRSSPIKLQGGDTKSPGPPLSDRNLSYSKLLEHKSSPKLSHSSKRSDTHAPRRTDSRNSDVHSPKLSDSHSSKSSSSRSKDLNNKDGHKRTTTERRDTKRGSTKPHPLHASHTTSDEEIIEETEQDEREGGVVGLAIDPIPMEEVSEDIPQEEDNNGETDDYLNEEFEEDYEEDFEETSNGSGDEGKREPSSSSDIDDVLQAIGQENERVDDQSSQLLNVISPSAPLPPPYLSPRPSMTFSATTQKLKETSIKIKTRGTELSNMIERDTLSINLFELQPLTEYGMYMRSFGQANTSQTGTQTGQDMVEEESQTEPITSRECWTQWPPHDMKGYGRYDDEDGDDSYVEYDTEKLIKFLQKASQVCDVLLEEDELYDANINSIKGREGENRRGDQYCTLESSLTLSGNAKCLALSSSHSDILVTGSQCKGGGDWIGFLGVWHLSHVQKHPQYALGDQSVPISCCVSFPLVFAGNDDGTVVLWDLTESVSQHKQYSLTNRDIVIRTPTYTTAAMGSGSEGGHTQPVIHVETSGATHDHSTIANDWHVQGLSYQLLSLDASGRVCVWVIVELPEGDPSGSPVDLGLAPGGRVKLVSSATLDTLSGSPIIDAVATGLIVSRADPNTLLIRTDTGAVVRHVRYRPRAVPKKYLMNNLTDSTIISPQVTSISIHPHFLSYFLVSYSSGHIALYDMHWPHPLITWPPGRQEQVIRELSWHPNLSNVFVCVGGDSEVHIWDLLTDDTGPVHTMKVEKKIVCMKIIANDNEPNSSLVVSSLDDVSVFRVESTKLYRANHLELFENFISENTHSM